MLATRRFESGVAFARDGSHDQALIDFTAVVDLYPDSAVADNALLEISRHYLDVVRDGPRARAAAERIANSSRYSQGDAALGAYIVLGRTMMMTARSENERLDALASFQRGLRLHPDSDAVPEGMYHVAEAYRRLDRPDAAFESYQQIVTAFPQNVWAIRARLGAGTMRAFQGDPVGAMEEFQRIREEFPERPEAVEALARTTILFRLHIRTAGATYSVSPAQPASRLDRRVIALATDTAGNVVYATDRGVSSLARGLRLPRVDRPRGLAVDGGGNVAVISRGRLERDTGPALVAAVPDDGELQPLTEIDAAVELSSGEWLVADRDQNAVLRFRDGAYVNRYAAVRARRLAVDSEDRIAMLDDDERLSVYADGREIAQIPMRNAAYRIDNPVDVAFDALGHLYLLDREGIYVFGRNLRLLRTFTRDTFATLPFDRATALAVDAYGRLFVADDRDDRIYVMQ